MKTIAKSWLHRPLFWALLALVLAAALKLWLIGTQQVSFNADEAIVALMARHILAGARPVFFYGQAYMGSLDAFLVAAGFAVFGQQVWVIRLVQALLYLGLIVTTGLLGRRAFGPVVGALAMLLMAIPTVNVSLYTTASLGGYGEAMLIGHLALLAALYIGERPAAWYAWLLLGVLGGLGLWAFGLALIYCLPAGVYALAALWRAEGGRARAARLALPLLALLLGACLGAAPWLLSVATHGLDALLFELGGGAIAGVDQLPWIFQVGKHLGVFLLLGVSVIFGFRPPWSAQWLGLLLLPFIFILWMGVLATMLRRLRTPGPGRPAQALLAGVMFTLVLLFVLTPFGADPSGRYFVPLAAPLAVFAAAAIYHWRARMGDWAYGLALLLLVYHAWGTWQAAIIPPGITTQFYAPAQVDQTYNQELRAFLLQQGETRGYSNYWVAYPMAFLSAEQIIYTPRLPYHPDFRYTSRDNRYPPYHAQVEQAQRVAYITTNHPALDDYLRARFSERGITWQERQIGNFQVFYALSQVVRPEQIGLGVTTSP